MTIRAILDRMDWLRGPLRPKLLVTGMPKSGTTALARLLGEAAGFRVVSDPFYLLDQRGVEFRDRLYEDPRGIGRLIAENRSVFRGDLVKDPNFIFFADVLLGRFPDAGFVVIVRDPRANIRSILNRLDLPGRSATPQQLAGISDTWRRVLVGRTPDLPCTNYVHCIAMRWRHAARAYLRDRDRMLMVRYEDFNRDKPGVVTTVLGRYGISDPRPIDHVMDKQFQPPGRKETDWREFFGPAGLAMVDEVCGAEMEQLGYRVGQRMPE